MKPDELPDEELFEAVLNCPTPEERSAHLDRVCSGQPELRERLEALLRAHEQAGGFLEQPAAAVDAVPELGPLRTSEEAPGTLIGRYKLLQKIGEGGMGNVYMAGQTEPVQRKVALKIIKLGMDTRQVVARFEAERQALALMDHPNIARVFDAGATESGRPYFVMELVHGVPITEYCDKTTLSTKERLQLFIPVCNAIQHAHQKGIIHRDIKPSNVMVTLHDGVPVAKVIDFGVAKATNQRLTENTLFTNYAQMIGTPAYMSPEQAEMSGLEIDTRTDVYSLGVLLYELLTGTTPFDARELLSGGYAEMQRIIAQQEPLKPSTRMSTMQQEQRAVVSKNRGFGGVALSRTLRGDLDWIVMKCLEKDRTRRYEAATALARDVQRHLNTEPVEARPPSRLYEFQKSVRRHKVGFAAVTAVMLVLSSGVIVSTWQAMRAKKAEQVALSTLQELQDTAPVFADQAQALVLQSKFDEAIERLDYAIALRPDRADYLVQKANLLQCQLKLPEAIAAYQTVLRVRPDHARARASLEISEELLAERNGTARKPAIAALNRLLAAMEAEQRSAAELLPISTRVGREKDVLLSYWLERLRDLPVTADRPLKERLNLSADGRFELFLDRTAITDLGRLESMPLWHLDLNDCAAIRDFTPLERIQLGSLNLDRTAIEDLSVLRNQTNLCHLDLWKTQVRDLSPLQGMRLTTLDISQCPISDLSPLQGMPLTHLKMEGAKVTSLAPLKAMPLRTLMCGDIPAGDFDELAGLPIENLHVQRNQVHDLGFVAGMPLRSLSLLGCQNARNFATLTNLAGLEDLILPSGALRLPEKEQCAIDALEQLSSLKQVTDEEESGILQYPKEQFWPRWRADRELPKKLIAAQVQFTLNRWEPNNVELTISSRSFRDLSMLEDAKITHLHLANTAVEDLSPLRNTPLQVLNVAGTRVQNLEPLRGKPLKQLFLHSSGVLDLGPLRGMPLEELHVAGTPVTDLSPLRGMPLRVLTFNHTAIADVLPLAELESLESVMACMSATNINLLRTLPKLRYLSYFWDPQSSRPNSTSEAFWSIREAMIRSVPEFLKQYDENDFYMWENQTDGLILEVHNRSFSDLSLLKGAPIGSLRLADTQVPDLSPLRGMPLKGLWLYHTQVRDLSPLKDMPLNDLNIEGCRVTDLAPLRGMPLEEFYMEGTLVTDIRPILEAPLNFLKLNEFARRVEDFNCVPTLTDLVIPRGAPYLPETSVLTNIQRLSYEWRGSPDGSGSLASMSVSAFWEEAFAADSTLPLRVAAVQAWHGRTDQLQATCRKALQLANSMGDGARADRAAKSCCLSPLVEPALQKSALDLVRAMLVANAPDNEFLSWFTMTLGMAEYRNGEFEAAELDLARAPELDHFNSQRIAGISSFYRVMSLHRLGREDEARRLFVTAVQAMPPLPANDGSFSSERIDHDDLIAWMAYKEAAALLAESHLQNP